MWLPIFIANFLPAALGLVPVGPRRSYPQSSQIDYTQDQETGFSSSRRAIASLQGGLEKRFLCGDGWYACEEMWCCPEMTYCGYGSCLWTCYATDTGRIPCGFTCCLADYYSCVAGSCIPNMSPPDGGADTGMTTTTTTASTPDKTDTGNDNSVTTVTSTPAADSGQKSGFDAWTVAEKAGLILGIIASVISIATLIYCGCHGWRM